MGSDWSKFLRQHWTVLSLFVAVIAVVLMTATLDDSYRRNPGTNAQELLRQTSLLGILALGAAVVIISGGIDLSSGSVVAFSSTIFASIVIMLAPHKHGDPLTRDLSTWILLAATAGTLFVSLLIGSFHTWLITVIKLPPFVATLASLVGLRPYSSQP